MTSAEIIADATNSIKGQLESIKTNKSESHWEKQWSGILEEMHIHPNLAVGDGHSSPHHSGVQQMARLADDHPVQTRGCGWTPIGIHWITTAWSQSRANTSLRQVKGKAGSRDMGSR
ncbi:hypothetical protein J3A83DRAFT_4190277 [Scleroderma citrinum]